jgi:hypothetical protein
VPPPSLLLAPGLRSEPGEIREPPPGPAAVPTATRARGWRPGALASANGAVSPAPLPCDLGCRCWGCLLAVGACSRCASRHSGEAWGQPPRLRSPACLRHVSAPRCLHAVAEHQLTRSRTTAGNALAPVCGGAGRRRASSAGSGLSSTRPGQRVADRAAVPHGTSSFAPLVPSVLTPRIVWACPAAVLEFKSSAALQVSTLLNCGGLTSEREDH